MKVYDRKHNPQHVEPALKSGGEGTVYPLSHRPELVVKVYHEHLRTELHRQDKIFAQMKLYADLQPLLKELPMAWPLIPVFDEQKQWVGYAMKKVNGKTMSVFRNPKLVRKHFPGLNRTRLIDYLINMLTTAERLHQQGIYMGDINLDNFLIDPKSTTVSFIDCDSYQIVSNGELYPCPVGQDAMIPPEHQGKKLSSVVRSEESDIFSLTVICFMLLMSGRHPYEHIGGASTTQNIANGHFPYGQPIRPGVDGAIPPGYWYIWWSHLSYNLKSAFMTTFTEGAHQPCKRVQLTELKKRLSQYKWSIEQGRLVNELWPTEAKQSKKIT